MGIYGFRVQNSCIHPTLCKFIKPFFDSRNKMHNECMLTGQHVLIPKSPSRQLVVLFTCSLFVKSSVRKPRDAVPYACRTWYQTQNGTRTGPQDTASTGTLTQYRYSNVLPNTIPDTVPDTVLGPTRYQKVPDANRVLVRVRVLVLD